MPVFEAAGVDLDEITPVLRDPILAQMSLTAMRGCTITCAACRKGTMHP
jgi:hypothetical protein